MAYLKAPVRRFLLILTASGAISTASPDILVFLILSSLMEIFTQTRKQKRSRLIRTLSRDWNTCGYLLTIQNIATQRHIFFPIAKKMHVKVVKTKQINQYSNLLFLENIIRAKITN